MELLAFVHSSVNYEDPTPDPELTLDIKVPGSAGVALAGVALAVAAVSASPDKASAATPAIAPGSSGAAVTNVQKTLGIEADGQFGARTEAAVMDFQIRQGLKQIDGVVGKETATALGLDEKYTPTCFGGGGDWGGGGCWGGGGWGGRGIDYRGIGGPYGGYVAVAFVPVVQRYYEPRGYDCYDDYDYCYEPRGYDCYDYYEPRRWDPCDDYYEPRRWDPCDDYYEPRGYYYAPYRYDDCYDPCDHYYEPRRWDPCDRYYEPRGYYGGGYGGYYDGGYGDCGGYEPYGYDDYGYDGGCGCH
jgi:hypothetical protein